MGMGEKKERAKNFKQKTAKVLEQQLEQPGLFAGKAVEAEHAVECHREPEDAPMSVGDRVKLVDMRDRIDVFIKTECVGLVLAGQVAELRERYQLEKRASRSVSGRISEISAISATFVVILGS
ncbi:MAG: hypothetical protein ACOZE5_09155 [Verrucomicrobiota bacterium]